MILMSEIRIRDVDSRVKHQLQLISKQRKYPSLTQFLQEVLKQTVQNNGLSIYDSDIGETLIRVKQGQDQLDQWLTSQMIDELRVADELETVRQLVEGWIEFDMIEEVLLNQIENEEGALGDEEE